MYQSGRDCRRKGANGITTMEIEDEEGFLFCYY